MNISVIIPAFNEESYLSDAIESVFLQEIAPLEVLVVDGGSADRTREIALKYARLFEAERSISKQKNAGARLAQGDVLLFLHADCRLEQGAFRDMAQTLENPKVVGGAFRHQLVGSKPWLDRFLSWSGSWNARCSQVYLGDHGIFCRRSAFNEAGGFPDIPLMYEFDFMRKLRTIGKLVQLNRKCFASARKFEENGYLKTITLMRALRAFYRLGLPTEKLQQLYLEAS